MGGLEETRFLMITDSSKVSNSPDEAAAALERHLPLLIRELSGRQVYIIKQVPEQFDFDPRQAFYSAVQTGQTISSQGVSLQESEIYQSRANAVIDSVGSMQGVHIVDPTVYFCSNKVTCMLRNKNILLYDDESHLSLAGALSLEPWFRPAFQHMHKK